MKNHIKLYEGFKSKHPMKDGVFTTESGILDFMWSTSSYQKREMTFKIHDDLTVDIKGKFNCSNFGLSKLPVVFNKCTGEFDCSRNNLTSLEGSPISVYGSFICHNNQLTSLEHCPLYIDGMAILSGNDKLTSLIFLPNLKNPTLHLNISRCGVCGDIYKNFGFCDLAHASSMFALDPDPGKTLEKIKHIYPDRYEAVLELGRDMLNNYRVKDRERYFDILYKSQLLRDLVGDDSEIIKAYDVSKNVEGDFY